MVNFNMPFSSDRKEDIENWLGLGFTHLGASGAIFLMTYFVEDLAQKYPEVISQDALGMLMFLAFMIGGLTVIVGLIEIIIGLAVYINSRGEEQ